MTRPPDPRELARAFPDLGRVESVVPLAGDGSSRRFFRIRMGQGSRVLLVGPDPRENAAYVRIGRHLGARRVRVPKVLGFDPGRGWILVEDLGDRNLFGALREPGADRLRLYGPVLDLLVRMQVAGSEGFRLEIGFAARPYGARTMVEDEGLYFAREFLEGVLGLRPPAGFGAELEALASRVPREGGRFFLHRDFQSRNIHLVADGPAVIDFQGARPGPLAYDVAALLLDPYANNPVNVREALMAGYLRRLRDAGAEQAWDPEAWAAVGTFRLLQALGAFAKLGWRMKKPGFREHVPAALGLLSEHLARVDGVAALRETVERARQAWALRSR
ncbi:aminoglycoside phosphotransferase family protein [Deferrisoma camini]|uniref:aminoglycoside phosphotransferase family protein n=1 Tax=Deferrisoma camini TaxID=1035120 RepID=UPI00046CAF89|nr:phosphotransferase [Deferrisoma camini]